MDIVGVVMHWVFRVKWYQVRPTDAFAIPLLYGTSHYMIQMQMFERRRSVMGKKCVLAIPGLFQCCAMDSALPHISICHMVKALVVSFKFKCAGYLYAILFITNERSTASSRLTISRLSGSQCKITM